QIDRFILQAHHFIQTYQQRGALYGRMESGDQEAMVASGIDSERGPRCITAEAIGYQPFAGQRGLEVLSVRLLEANLWHLRSRTRSSVGRRRPRADPPFMTGNRGVDTFESHS